MFTERPDDFVTGFADRSYDKIFYHAVNQETETERKEETADK